MKTLQKLIGVVVILGVLFGGNLKHIAYWATPYAVGFNTVSLAILVFGIWLVHKGFKKSDTV